MGTHPIFESDFDCLTVLRMWWVIRPLLVSLVSCATITGKLKENPYEAPEFIGLQVVLDDGYTGFITKDGSFNVHQVPVGTYVLNVVGSKLTYPPVRVDSEIQVRFPLESSIFC